METIAQSGGFLKEFKALPNWLLWRNEARNGKTPTKVPYSAHGGGGSSTDPATWATFEEASSAVGNYDGLGFAITDGNVLIDLDGCRDPKTGKIDAWAQFIVDFLMCPTEISPSGAGLHIYVKGKNARSLKRMFATGAKKRGIEVYAGGRYSCITFNHLSGTPLEIPEVDLTQFLNFAEQGSFDPEDVRDARVTEQVTEVCTGWEKQKTFYSSTASTFDLARWLGTFGVGVLREKPDGTYIVACPGTHGDYDKRDGHAFVKQLPSGALAMGCLHGSCSLSNGSGNHWQEFRRIMEGPIGRAVHDAGGGAGKPPATIVEVDAEKRHDMPEDVLDGRLGEIFQRRMKGCCIAYAWPSLLVLAGTTPTLKFDGNKLRANLFVCLVGPTDTGKSATFDRARHVLGIDSTSPLVVSAKYGSGEALMQELDRERPSTRLLYPDELKHLLVKAELEGASYPTLLTTAYYHDQQKGGTKKKGKDAKEQFEIDCRLSIAGGVVEDDFGACFGSASVSGLYDRFLFGLCPKPYVYLYQPPDDREQPETVSAFAPGIAPNVWDERNQWIKDGISPRVAEHALRCGYIAAAVDRRDELQASQLGSALALARYQMKFRSVMRPNPGENPVAQCAISVRSWLEQHNPGEWVRRRILAKGIHSERLGPQVFNNTLAHLGLNNEVEVDFKQKIVRLIPESGQQ